MQLRSLVAPTLLASLLAAPVTFGQIATPTPRNTPNRNFPVNIDADSVTVDDRNKVHVFEGGVLLTQGTMTIKSNKLVVTQDSAGFHNGVASGGERGLATFTQKREDGSLVEGEGERIEYSSKTEKAKLFNRARVKNGGDLVTGNYLEYDATTETYLAANRGEATGQRVHVTIQPKQKAEKDSKTKDKSPK